MVLHVRHIQLEINQLKSKIDQMSYGNQNTSAAPHVPNMQNHSYIPPPPTYIVCSKRGLQIGPIQRMGAAPRVIHTGRFFVLIPL
jgi:hypothetical protein